MEIRLIPCRIGIIIIIPQIESGDVHTILISFDLFHQYVDTDVVTVIVKGMRADGVEVAHFD